MSFIAIRENKILMKISKSTVNQIYCHADESSKGSENYIKFMRSFICLFDYEHDKFHAQLS